MKELPTAEEFLIRQGCVRMDCDGDNCDFFEDVQPKDLIEFAKLHVEAALKAASENAKIIDVGIDYAIVKWVVEKDSILNSYLVEKIK